MAKKSLNKQLSLKSSALVLLTAGLIIGTVELQALKAKEQAAKPPSTINSMECIRCHSDPASIKRMWEKEDGAHFLFNPDGTFKDANLPGTNFKHPNKEAVAKALQEWNASPQIAPPAKKQAAPKNSANANQKVDRASVAPPKHSSPW